MPESKSGPTSERRGSSGKARVFISYSRKDMPFADRLEAALKARGIEPLIDRTEIYAFEDWWKRIEALITQADTVVFVLSPDAVASDICQKEVAFAASLNKRFAPIVAKPVADEQVPEELRRLNFIFFDDEARFEAAADQLAEALATDIEWIRKHTEIGELARRWTVAGRPGPKGLLLRSPLLDEAERWIAARPQNAPPPTDDARAFIAESRRAATRRQRMAVAGALTVALIAGGLAVLAEVNRREATQQRAEATKQRDQALLTQSRFLADLAAQRIDNGDAVTGMLLAMEALPDAREPEDTRRSRPYASEAEQAFYRSFYQKRERVVVGTGARDQVVGAFSPGGDRIVTARGENDGKIADTAAGRTLAKLQGHTKPIRGAAFSPDGERVLTWSADTTARVWNARDGTLIATMAGHTQPIVAAFFTADGARVVTAADTTGRVWDAKSGQQLLTLSGHEVPAPPPHVPPVGLPGVPDYFKPTPQSDASLRDILKAAIIGASMSADGKRLLTNGRDGTARVWDVDTGQELRLLRSESTLPAAQQGILSADGKIAATVTDRPISQVTNTEPQDFVVLRFWDVDGGTQISELKGPWSTVTGRLAFSPDARLLALTDGRRVRLFEVAGARLVGILEGHQADVGQLAFSKDGSRLLTGSRDGSARLWDVKTATLIESFAGHHQFDVHARFSPDEATVLTSGADGSARLWSLEPTTESSITMKLDGLAGDFAFSPDGALFAACAMAPTSNPDDYLSAKSTIGVWDVVSGSRLAQLSDLAGGCAFSFSHDGKLIATHPNQQVVIFEARSGKPVKTIAAPVESLGGVKFSPDDKQVLTTSLGTGIGVWDVATGSLVRNLLPGMLMSDLTFTADGKLLVAWTFDGTVGVWDAASGSMRGQLVPQNREPQYVGLAPDGKRIVTSGGGKLRIWSMPTPEAPNAALLADLVIDRKGAPNPGTPGRFTFMPNGSQLLVSYTLEQVLWDLNSYQFVKGVRTLSSSLFGPAVTPDGKRLVVTRGGPFSTLLVADLETGDVPLLERVPHAYGGDVAVSPDGRTIATTKRLIDSSIRLWRVFPDRETLLAAGKKLATRCLSPAERQRYFLAEDAPDWCRVSGKWPYVKPRLGISMAEPEDGGAVRVERAYAGGLAERAGFRASDVIVAVDGEPITAPARVTELIRQTPAGGRRTFTIKRAGTKLDITVAFPVEADDQ